MHLRPLAILALLVAAACTHTPTAATVRRSPAFDGLGLASGNVVAPGGTATTATASDETVTAADSTISGRGGLGLGSGH
jgi:hypothetical protein